MKTKMLLLMAVAGIALGGCAITNVDDVNAMRTVAAHSGTPFTQALTNEYRAQATNEADNEGEWDDAAFFARKGLQAAKGEAPAPAEPSAAPVQSALRFGQLGPVLQIPAGRVPALAEARGRLVSFLDGGGREHKPVIAARAQALYDCWLEEEWEGEAVNACRTEFLKIEPQFAIAAAAPRGQAPEAVPKVNTFQVFFDFDRSNIGDIAAQIIERAAASAKQGNITRIKLTGHTDSVGTVDYNQALSERRAAAVKAELVRDGVPATEITSIGVGKAGQLVPTADGVREPQNRRTEIVLE